MHRSPIFELHHFVFYEFIGEMNLFTILTQMYVPNITVQRWDRGLAEMTSYNILQAVLRVNIYYIRSLVFSQRKRKLYQHECHIFHRNVHIFLWNVLTFSNRSPILKLHHLMFFRFIREMLPLTVF